MADWKDGVRRILYPAYEARLRNRLDSAKLPKHIGVMLDGNRRWAKEVGRDTAHGHRAGAANIEPLLTWCDEVGIEVVTLWLLSTDNLHRPETELESLLCHAPVGLAFLDRHLKGKAPASAEGALPGQS